MAERDCDVAIVGAGMVGAALACALAQRGFAVIVVETRLPATDWPADSVDLRVSALTRASENLLRNLGAWDAVAADRATPYERMQVWDRVGLGEIRFDAADIGEPNLGHIVENRVLVRALWQRLVELGVTVRAPAGLQAVTADADGAVLQTDDGARLVAGLVVGADGARSRVREHAGVELDSAAYDQHALVATVRAELGNSATAWQRFLRTGPLALLPVMDEYFSIVWSTTPEQAQRLSTLSPEAFDDALTEASESCAGQLHLLGDRAVFPLRMQHARQYVLPGIALVGDAAHVIHPLAGQGVNLGLLDAGALVDALIDGRRRGYPPGALRPLRAYERARRGHNRATQLAMDGFKQLFGSSSLPLDGLRNLGLGLAGRIAPLRRTFERVALGAGVELPALCRMSATSRD